MSALLEGCYLTEGPHGWPAQMQVAELDGPFLIGWRDCDWCRKWRAADYGVTCRFGKTQDRAEGYTDEGRREANVCTPCLLRELARPCCVREPENTNCAGDF